MYHFNGVGTSLSSKSLSANLLSYPPHLPLLFLIHRRFINHSRIQNRIPHDFPDKRHFPRSWQCPIHNISNKQARCNGCSDPSNLFPEPGNIQAGIFVIEPVHDQAMAILARLVIGSFEPTIVTS